MRGTICVICLHFFSFNKCPQYFYTLMRLRQEKSKFSFTEGTWTLSWSEVKKMTTTITKTCAVEYVPNTLRAPSSSSFCGVTHPTLTSQPIARCQRRKRKREAIPTRRTPRELEGGAWPGCTVVGRPDPSCTPRRTPQLQPPKHLLLQVVGRRTSLEDREAQGSSAYYNATGVRGELYHRGHDASLWHFTVAMGLYR